MKPRKTYFKYEIHKAYEDLAWGLILVLLGAFAGVCLAVQI